MGARRNGNLTMRPSRRRKDLATPTAVECGGGGAQLETLGGTINGRSNRFIWIYR